MVSTYLSSKAIIDELLANDKFVYRAKLIVNSNRATPEYLTDYRALDNILKELRINNQVDIFKSDGGYWYSNILTPNDPILINNFNTAPEIFSALNYAFGNPICNKKIYPLELQSSVCSGYGFAEILSKYSFVNEQYVAKTYKQTSSPLSTDVFTLRVVQDT